MTREEFIEILDENGYSYKIEGDKLVVDKYGSVYLNSLETLPPGVVFKNGGNVFLDSLKTLPPGVEFKNGDDVHLDSLKIIPPGVEFKNGGSVFLNSLKTLPPGVEFKNGGWVDLNSLIGGSFSKWNGKIEGIASNTLLNGMIKRVIFL